MVKDAKVYFQEEVLDRTRQQEISYEKLLGGFVVENQFLV